MQEGGNHGAHTLRGDGGREWPQQPSRWAAPGFPQPPLGAAGRRRPPTRAPPPTEPCQAPPPFCTHTQHDTGPVTRTQHPASGRRAARPPPAQTGLAGRGTDRSGCATRGLRSAASAVRAEGAEVGTASRGHPQARGTKRPGSGSTDETRLMHGHASSAHTRVPSRTHPPLEYTHPSPMASRPLTHAPSHSYPPPTQGPGIYRQPPCGHVRADTRAPSLATLSALGPSAPLSLWRPCPAPALLSTRDWPTRIRMLDARMDRQKFNKMMERSDFMNLRGHGGQGRRS